MKLRTFGLSLIGAASLAVLPACTKDEASKPAPSTPAEQGKPSTPETTPTQAQTPPAPAGKSTIKGVVKFTGTPPAPADIPASADPACEGMALKEPAVLVKDGKLQNVLVRVKGAVAGAPAAPSTPVVIDQVKCTYTPRVHGGPGGPAHPGEEQRRDAAQRARHGGHQAHLQPGPAAVHATGDQDRARLTRSSSRSSATCTRGCARTSA